MGILIATQDYHCEFPINTINSLMFGTLKDLQERRR
jgi:hypothetical protein